MVQNRSVLGSAESRRLRRQGLIPGHLHGEPAGALDGGVLTQVTNELNVEALPMEVPEHLEVDVSALQVGESLRLSALQPPAGVTLLDDADETVLATVTAPIREEEPEEAAEGEVPEGEAGAAEAAAEGVADAG